MELLTFGGDAYKPSEIQELLQKYHKAFKVLPMELPPNRKIEHIIEIKSGAKPINIKLYRCPHHHKT